MPSKTKGHLWVPTRVPSVNSIGHFVHHKYFIGYSSAVLRTKSKRQKQAPDLSTAKILYGVRYVPRHSTVLLSTIWNEEREERNEGEAMRKKRIKRSNTRKPRATSTFASMIQPV
jgi:hypothetical protein